MQKLTLFLSLLISLNIFSPAVADSNYDRAGVLLADSAGRQNPQNYRAAWLLYRASQAANFLPANGRLGDMYLNGQGVTASAEKAAEYYRTGADGRDPYSLFRLGVVMSEGKGMPADPLQGRNYIDQAISLYQQQAAAGDAQAQYFIGLQSLIGNYLPQSDNIAVSLLTQAAAQNHRQSLLVLGQYYDHANLPAKAVDYFKKAIEQGEYLAYVDLGNYYFYKDPRQSRAYFERGCEHDIRLACENLASVEEYIKTSGR